MQNEYRSISIFFVIIFIVIVFFSLSYHFFNKTESNWSTYANRVAIIDSSVSRLKALIGYGGFIHDFKNMILRRDISSYEKKLKKEIVEIPIEIDLLNKLMSSSEDRQALNDIRTTFEEYASKYEQAKKMILAGDGNEDIDKVVKVDDTKAIAALLHLDYRVNERLSLAHKNAEKSYFIAMSFYIISTLVFLVVVLTAALFLVRQERKVVSMAKSEVAAREQAEYSNLSKSQFLSSMSHELRTPLNAIIGFGQLLEMGAKDDDTKANVHEITSAGDHLLNLINDILDLSAIESGKLSVSMDDIFLKDVFTETLSLITPLAQRRDIQIIGPSVEFTECYVRADYMRLKQVLLNLLSNAVKYNREGGSITINGETYTNNKMRVTVTDTGMGMSDSQLEQLFQEFNRVGAEQTDIEGTGIGLVIAKRLIEIMGGTIGVESRQGKGTSFWIELNVPENSESLTIEQSDKITDTTESDDIVTTNKTILYIEDNPANLRLVSKIITQNSSHDLISAPDGRLGIDLALTQQPELILLDINLPHQDGYAVFKRLREIDDTKNIPVIAVTANAMISDIEKGKKAGFTDYITKPIEFNKLLDAISKVLD